MRYLLGIAATTVTAAALWLAAYAGLMRPSAEVVWVADMLDRKTAIAERLPGPKLVAIGGSGVHFGIDTRLIERATGSPAVNLGGHGGLGLRYLLDRARRVLRPGDTALLAIEYELLTASDRPGKTLRELVFFRDRGYLARVPLLQIPLFASAASPDELVWRMLAEGRRGQAILGRFVLSADNLDSRGNETVNREAIVDALLREQVALGPAVAAAGRPSPDAVSALHAFRDWARETGVAVVATWPNTLYRAQYRDPLYSEGFARLAALLSGLDYPVVGSPYEAMLAPEDMFDTVYHPNDVGRAKRTRALIAALCAGRLRCRTETARHAADGAGRGD